MRAGWSPATKARIGGALYLAVILCGGFAEIAVRQAVFAPGDAARTSANILSHETLYRLGLLADLLPLLFNMALGAVFYDLFRPVNATGARLVVFFTLAGSAVQASMLLFHLMPLIVLKSAGLGAFALEQREALAYLALRLQSNGYNIALAFFGCFGLSLGALILKSRFLPRVLGVLMALAGACYLTNSLLGLVAPQMTSMLLLIPCLLGEGALTLWLLLAGVNTARWRAQAEAA